MRTLLVRHLLFAVLFASVVSSVASDLRLSGTMSWRRVGTRIDISADRVINDSFGGISGTLRLQIWATTSPYFGGSISGYILGTRSLGQLEGGYQFTGVSGSVPFRAPPAGNYYTTMTLEEYTVNGYVIVDYTTFDGTSSFGGVAGGGGGGGGFNGDLSIGGFVSWASRGSRVTFTVGDISNDRDSGRSGSLRLRLWATTSPYDGGSIFGYVLGTKKLKPLYGNQYYSSLVQPTTFRRPRSGYYFTTLTLEEFTSDGWVIVDYVTFPGLTRF